MTTEYPLQEGEPIHGLARELLDAANDPSQVAWSPRPDTPGGGVFVVTDETVAQRVLDRRRERAQGEQDRINASLAAADERDSSEAVASGLLTPAEAGFAANAGTDPGAPGTEGERLDDEESDEDAEPTEDDPATAEDESAPKTTAAKRRAAKAAKAAAAPADDAEQKTE